MTRQNGEKLARKIVSSIDVATMHVIITTYIQGCDDVH